MLTCLNCKAPVAEEDIKFFGKAFVCAVCHTTATHFYERLTKDLKNLLLVAHEAIRVALVEGRFHLAENGLKEVSKKELLEEILKMTQYKEARDKNRECSNSQSDQVTRSGQSTPPHVRTLAALGKSPSSKPNPQD